MHSNRRDFLSVGSAVVAGALWPGFGHAQAWPAKPIRVVVAFPPGIGVDAQARAVIPKLADILQTWLAQSGITDPTGKKG